MKRRIERWIRILIALNVVIVAGLAAVIAFDLIRASGGRLPALPGSVAGRGTTEFSAPASASASPELMEMGVAHIPTTNACVLCHGEGGKVKAVPAVLHPLEGWRRCLVCHSNEDLGRKAPGHEGIAEEECLNCHKVAQTGPAITQPHAELQDQRCLTCHGNVAHLPETMASSNETDCVLCHKPTTLPPPAYPHVDDPRLSCRSCHQSAEAGALPIDHALRSDTTCLLCHELKIAPPGTSPIPLPLPSGSATPGSPEASPPIGSAAPIS